jgi:nicotinamidase-related amidase
MPRPASFPANPQNLVLDVARTGLVVVDMQNDFCSKGGWFAEKGADVSVPHRIVPALQKLLIAFRAAGAPVFWLNWGNRPDSSDLPPSLLHAGKPHGTGPGYGDVLPSGKDPVLVRGSHGAAVIDTLKAEPSDIFVHKTRFDGFIDNEFDSILRNRNITTLAFAGINTDRCVFATLIHASFLGYDCILVEDACATSSPVQCTEAVTFLVHLLYGFTATTGALIKGLTECSEVRQAQASQGLQESVQRRR